MMSYFEPSLAHPGLIDVLAFLQYDWFALWAATLHNSMYGNVPGLLSPYKIGLDAPG